MIIVIYNVTPVLSSMLTCTCCVMSSHNAN